ncbi:nuclear transport factor 2 family protein [Mycobacterium sp. NAZ190054]|uniref:YybH family protein n=1 Tax=Mycobacterium sp. NAZ190054 TaxID=1747766 RepID=UPI00079C42BE|nr:nuclear transport factor 2 family protein [Mycobacterium sp. NAZ190054]KWX67211.1 hypothetical protein ASJ79_22515 [Mycobacterium sp. NAZ190054]
MTVPSYEDDKAEVLRISRDYLILNGVLDVEGLKELWSTEPGYIYFNRSGHNYTREAWLRLWAHYRTRFSHAKAYETSDVEVEVVGDLAWVNCLRSGETHWISSDENPFANEDPNQVISRSTEIFRREADGWKVVHVHFSLTEERIVTRELSDVIH